MNSVILVGRLTATPELKQSQNGTTSTRFCVAVDRIVKQGEKQADFIPCVAFGKTAEFVTRYFFKGSRICLSGNIKTGSYDDRNHPDVKHYTADVWVDRVEFCESKSAQQPQQTTQGGYVAPQPQQRMPYTYNTQQPPQAQQMQFNSYGEVQPGQAIPFNPNDFTDIIGNDSDLPF